MRMVQDVLKAVPAGPAKLLPEPLYTPGSSGPNVMLAVSSMANHTTDEGWQIAQALEYAGYELAGSGCIKHNETDVRKLLQLGPRTVVVQDKREWDVQPGDFRDPKARFRNIEVLAERNDVFKLTVLKDAHQRPEYHRASAEEMGCHAWIVYYSRSIVKHLAPYIRPEHMVRTWHTVNAAIVPCYTAEFRRGCVLSGAVSGAYPLRKRLFDGAAELPDTVVLTHPGYHRNGSATPDFLRVLSRFKVAICTSSIYGYALRKLIEATACGCVVVTDLPCDEYIPAIDANMVRIAPTASVSEVGALVRELAGGYDPERQKFFAESACAHFDYRRQGRLLAHSIEEARCLYSRENSTNQ